MAGADVGSARPKNNGAKTGRRRPRRRLGVRIDMTPMVDIAFLLLIFYMVTTVFSMPQALEVNLPPLTDETPKVNRLLTLRIDDQNRFFWNMGKNDPVPMRTDSLRALMADKNREFPKLNTLIIIHKKARYRVLVDILDEIDLIERAYNASIAANMGVTSEEFNDPSSESYFKYRDKRFSYRYAVAPWEDRDTRIIEKTLRIMEGG